MASAEDMHLGMSAVNAIGHENPCANALVNRAQKRYLLLLDQLIEADAREQGKDPPAYGWQMRILPRLGITQPHLSKIYSHRIRPTVDAIEGAIRKVPVDPAYFFAALQEEPHFRDYRGPRRIGLSMGYPALRRFLEAAKQGGMLPNEQERHILERQEWEGEPSEATYTLFLQALRTIKIPAQTSVRHRGKQRAHSED